MNIRIAQKEDAPAMVAFNQAMAMETEGKHLDTQIITSGVETVFHNENCGFYVVAEDAGRVIGGLMITYEWSDWRDAWFWWIQSVYVIPEYRGQGVYPALYEYVKERAREEEDVCGIRLYVEKENAKAQHVYEKLGMEQSHYLMYEEML